MTGDEFRQAREAFKMTPGEFAFLLGYGLDKVPGEGNRFANRNARTTIIRYERGVREIPPIVARLVQMLRWYHGDYGQLPDFEKGQR